ncbi:MAG: L-threonylcarbamoyladenylate synthase [Blastocatellia bacterium]|nr:L-threonylcarbamoyladenylate synthase [Blastocatellia bacterium]
MFITETLNSYSRAAEIIARGGVIAFRTDTFYGLGADPFNRDAVQRIKQLKGREERQPILIVLSERAAVKRFVAEPSRAFQLLADRFWPGPLTLIGDAVAEIPEEVTAGTKTIGVRLPDDDRVRALVQACGGALTATSANPSHEEPARTAPQVFSYFENGIDLIVDDGDVVTDLPSTVVDACGVAPRLIREGAIKWSAIRAELSKPNVKRT